MIDTIQRPINHRRLAKMLRGLQRRLSTSSQQAADEIEQKRALAEAAKLDYEATAARLTQAARKQVAVSTTLWDEAIHDCWDRQERLAYRAVHQTRVEEAQLLEQAKERVQSITNQAKAKIAQIEKRFLKAKDVPLDRLKKWRAENRRAVEELSSLENAARTAVTQRGLHVPSSPAAAAVESVTDSERPTTIEDAQRICRAALERAREHYAQLSSNALARFFDGPWWWGACGLLMLIVALTGHLLVGLSPINSALSGAVAAALSLLVGFIAVRPWLKRSASALYPRIIEDIELGKHWCTVAEQLAVKQNDDELVRLARLRDDQFEQIKSWRDQQAEEIRQSAHQAIRELKQAATAQKMQASHDLTKGLETLDARFRGRLANEEQQRTDEISALTQEFERRQSEVDREVRLLNENRGIRVQSALRRTVGILNSHAGWCQQHFPDWTGLCLEASSSTQAGLDQPLLPIGRFNLLADFQPSYREQIAEALEREQAEEVRVLFSALEDGYLVIAGEPTVPAVQDEVRGLIMRALCGFPAGGVQVCVIDSQGLGRDFGWLMHLGDFDPELVTHRVWTQPGHIAKQLAAWAMLAENFIQQSLRNVYPTIVEYNRVAGSLAEPFRILLWNSFPLGLDDHSWKHLQALLDAGARCGLVPVLVIDPRTPWPSVEQREWISRRGLHLSLTADKREFEIRSPWMDGFRVCGESPPTDQQARRLVQEIGRGALLAQRVKVPLERVLPAPDQRWKGDSTNCLEIPIGLSSADRSHCLNLGLGTAQHAVIAGKTGSGKSSLLHAIISSAALKYAPEHLRLVLLDFKKGVEFQVYAESNLPHVDIIGIESHREFGVSALQYVDRCMQLRGEQFRGHGVQDLAAWNALHPEQSMPRILLIIDEFQELFVEEDKLASQASLLLDRIVRQGRSFGVHAVLSSQTLSGAYSLPRATLGQMAVRIALQCDASDAQVVFAEDNPAANRLKHPGQAVYNNAGGRIEGNQPLQIGWVTKAEQRKWFSQLEPGYRNLDSTTNQLGQTVVYEGNRPAEWSEQQSAQAVRLAKQNVNPDATWCVVGQSVAIDPPVTFPLTRQSGRNVLLVGGNDAAAAAVLYVVNRSVIRDARQRGCEAHLFVIQGARPTDARTAALPRLWRDAGLTLQLAIPRDTRQILEEVRQILRDRVEQDADGAETPPIMLNLIQLGRLRDLRKEDEFSLDAYGEASDTPDKLLEEILRDGPAFGMHTLIWADNYSTVSRWLSRSSLRELEVRLLMQMSANDSTNLTDSVEASRLDEHVMLLADEATGVNERFRPYDFESLREKVIW